ncbi:MAG: YkgJ family cysteine cluster protein [Campylobacterota bacterium]|nr:YkgJ family cysteine cluster protein [Campylobacterota bacterium]
MFGCTGCGLCCRHIEKIVELKDYNLGNGVCKHLDTITNNCMIYDSRPNICKVDKMFDIEYHKKFSKEEFYIKNAEVCNSLQAMHKVDKSYRVEIKE